MTDLERAVLASAERWLAARDEAIRLLANGEPASQAVSEMGNAEAALAAAVRAKQKDQSE